MTLDLNARQRAMLDEMGVKVWWPAAPVALAAPAAAADLMIVEAVPAPRDAPPVTAPAPAPRFAASPRAAVPPKVERPTTSPANPASLASPPLAATDGVMLLLEPPQRLYHDSGPVDGGWLIVADMPPEADSRDDGVFAGDAGRLLDNMLRALQLDQHGHPVHLMRAYRGSPLGGTGDARPFADSFPAHAAALAPRIVLTMGPLATQTLLASTDPLGRLRGGTHPLPSVPGAALVATYPPAYLLRNPADKAKAWADLCLAAAAMDSADT